MTGKSIHFVDVSAQLFQSEKPYDKVLLLMELEDYKDENGTTNRQIKKLIINGDKEPYKDRLIKIRI